MNFSGGENRKCIFNLSKLFEFLTSMSRPFKCLIDDGKKYFLESDVLHLGTLMI